MKLFTVTVEYEYVVAAEDFNDANDVARDHALEAMKDLSTYELDYRIFQGVAANGWTDDALPYGGEGNKTVGDYKNE
jgi:hypothetical protein